MDMEQGNQGSSISTANTDSHQSTLRERREAGTGPKRTMLGYLMFVEDYVKLRQVGEPGWNMRCSNAPLICNMAWNQLTPLEREAYNIRSLSYYQPPTSNQIASEPQLWNTVEAIGYNRDDENAPSCLIQIAANHTVRVLARQQVVVQHSVIVKKEKEREDVVAASSSTGGGTVAFISRAQKNNMKSQQTQQVSTTANNANTQVPDLVHQRGFKWFCKDVVRFGIQHMPRCLDEDSLSPTPTFDYAKAWDNLLECDREAYCIRGTKDYKPPTENQKKENPDLWNAVAAIGTSSLRFSLRRDDRGMKAKNATNTGLRTITEHNFGPLVAVSVSTEHDGSSTNVTAQLDVDDAAGLGVNVMGVGYDGGNGTQEDTPSSVGVDQEDPINPSIGVAVAGPSNVSAVVHLQVPHVPFLRNGGENRGGGPKDNVINRRREGTPKRPITAYFQFLHNASPSRGSVAEKSGIPLLMSLLWSQMSKEAKAPYFAMYELDKQRFDKEMALFLQNQGANGVDAHPPLAPAPPSLLEDQQQVKQGDQEKEEENMDDENQDE